MKFDFTFVTSGPCAEAKLDPIQLRSQARFGKVADFTLDITEEDISLLSVSITSPSGRDVSCLLKRQPDSHIGENTKAKWFVSGFFRLQDSLSLSFRCVGVSFIPKEAGEHLLSVLRNGEHVASSPIPLTIDPSEIGDASRVKVFGPGLTRGYTCQMSSFVVDTREAGKFLCFFRCQYCISQICSV